MKKERKGLPLTHVRRAPGRMAGDDRHSFKSGIEVKSLEYFESVGLGLVGDDGLAARQRPVDGG